MFYIFSVYIDVSLILCYQPLFIHFNLTYPFTVISSYQSYLFINFQSEFSCQRMHQPGVREPRYKNDRLANSCESNLQYS